MHWRSRVKTKKNPGDERQRQSPGGDFQALPTLLPPPSHSCQPSGGARAEIRARPTKELGSSRIFQTGDAENPNARIVPWEDLSSTLEYLKQGEVGWFWTKELLLTHRMEYLKCSYSVQDQTPQMKRQQLQLGEIGLN